MKIQTDNWKSFRLKDIAVISTGSTPPTKNRENFGDEYGFATPGDICGTRFIKKTAIKLSNKGIIKTRLAREGSVLFVCIGSTIGKVAQIAEAMAYNQQINACTAKEGVDQSFFYYALLNCSSMVRRMAGTQAVPIVNKSTFQHIQINLPPIAEQRKIAEILSAQDRVIELKTKLLEEKKRLKKYLCQSLLRGKTRISGYTGVWKRKRLCDIAHRVTARNTKNCNNVLTISACDGLVEQEAYFKKEVAGKDKSNYFFLSQDDYAYNRSSSRGNPYGAIKRLRKHSSGIVSPLYVCFRMNKELVDYNYAEYAFDSGVLNKELGMVVQEGARNHGLLNIAIEDFFNCRIELPAYDEQVKIAEILRVVFYSVELQEKELEQEKLKKKAMMQQLLTGKVRVSV